MNIYIGNFSYEITEEELKSVFASFGQVDTAKIIKDKFTGASRGFGFVEMPNRTQAQAALQGVTEIKGRRITINEARPQLKNNFGPSRHSGPRKSSGYRREQRY